MTKEPPGEPHGEVEDESNDPHASAWDADAEEPVTYAYEDGADEQAGEAQGQYYDGATYDYEAGYAEDARGYEHWDADQGSWAEQRRGRAATIGLALALVVSLAGNALLGARLRDTSDDISRLEKRQTELQQQLDELRGQAGGLGRPGPLRAIAAAVESLRGLRFKTEVRPEVLAPAGFRERVRREMDAEADSEETRATQNVLRLLGVVPADYDLERETRAIQEEQVGGFYDNKGKKLVVPSNDANNPSPLDRSVLAHEYTHALTDQYYNLGRLDRLRDQGRDDEAAAFVALAEGDAEAVRKLYQTTILTDADRQELSRTQIDAERFNAAPPFLQDVFLFPYIEGAAFVDALMRDGGFDRVNAAYEDPPDSTEQILHPEKYLERRDEPVDVRLPDVGRALGSGWRSIDSGEVGELDLRLIAQYGGSGLSTRKARSASAGWDGGSYRAFDSAAGTLIAMSTAWDARAEADEAARLFGEWIPSRFGNQGQDFDVAGGRGWEAQDGAGAALIRDGRVVILLGPDRASIQKAADAF